MPRRRVSGPRGPVFPGGPLFPAAGEYWRESRFSHLTFQQGLAFTKLCNSSLSNALNHSKCWNNYVSSFRGIFLTHTQTTYRCTLLIYKTYLRRLPFHIPPYFTYLIVGSLHQILQATFDRLPLCRYPSLFLYTFTRGNKTISTIVRPNIPSNNLKERFLKKRPKKWTVAPAAMLNLTHYYVRAFRWKGSNDRTDTVLF